MYQAKIVLLVNSTKPLRKNYNCSLKSLSEDRNIENTSLLILLGNTLMPYYHKPNSKKENYSPEPLMNVDATSF